MSADSADVKSLFGQAMALPPQQRAAFLQERCEGNPGLRAEIESLLGAYQEAGSFLGELLPALAPAEPVRERPGTAVGPYRLLRLIGQGGFGVVFLAEQQHPVRRTVALKVLKPDMDTRQVVARFEAERQALALMDHPNIARVLDAGTTEGEPYFVMELVQGVPITAYCDENRLTPRQRLELFIPVCQAVQHAHQKGIIHRDLKPSNVLVAVCDGRPVPKVIDFGIAKVTGPRITERSLITDVGSVLGTLEYMSPEQAEPGQLDIDTRSDIYSLGVLLYELLTGTTPLDRKPLKGAMLLEALRLIREEEPPRPSARLSTTEQLPAIAANRGLEPKALSGLVRGELDWIVMKCLDKDRTRRYESANALARDLERYLADEPVEACPPSAGYRLRKFARKNRKLLATVAAFMVVLLLGGAITAWQGVQLARAEREQAERALAQARRAREVQAALTRARELREQGRAAPGDLAKWAEALALTRRAEALLENDTAEPELARQVQELLRELADEEADRRLLARLEEIRLSQAEFNGKENRVHPEGALPEYRRAFRDYGLPAEEAPEPVAAGLRLRPPAVRAALVTALDRWLDLARVQKGPETQWLQGVLSLADADPWRQRLRVARAREDRQALERLAREVDVASQPPEALLLLAAALRRCGAREATVALLRRAHEVHPGDFWINHDLGQALAECQPPDNDAASRFLKAAAP